ncbi:MAG: hypothetical protein F2839_07415 [Actinobacteria bacterium]|uniref:Unannotated protein n=1 Tax=freshwater metagenome TaxID=449393 RepID=A0A6J5ZU38_9ZZZZ|nr:hypothetical protein [Actinomycetota bacterium]
MNQIMRVWIPLDEKSIAALGAQNSIQVTEGFSLTQQWLAECDEDDPEILEDDLLYESGAHSMAVIVANVAAIETGHSATVQIQQPVAAQDVVAFFARSSLDEDFSWFGPSEIHNFLELVQRQ